MRLFDSIDVSGCTRLTKVAMFLLAAYPIIGVYVFMNTPFNYATLSSLLLIMLLFARKGLNLLSILPVSYYIFWIYAAFQMVFVAGIVGWSDYFPGGVNICLFSFSIIAYAVLFDMKCLYKYMRIIWLFATVLFLFQFIMFYITGAKISVFLPLSQNLTYCGFSLDEMIAVHTSYSRGLIERFCSIFCEPSYFGQYSVVFLAIELFRNEAKDKLFTPLSLLIAIIIILIQSGSGLLGLGLVFVIKLLHIVIALRKSKYYLLLCLLIPLFIYVLNRYLGSDLGLYVVTRTSELQMNEASTQSGNMRLYYGWFQYSMMPAFNQMFGSSRAFLSSILNADGFINGACSLFMGLGWLGGVLLSLFYLIITKRNVFSITILLLFIYFMLVESIYLGGIMVICTAVLLGLRYQTKNNQLTEY